MKTIKIDTDSGEVYNAFLCIVSKQGSRKAFDRVMGKRPNGENIFEIELKINGEEFDFEELVKEMMRQFDDCVKRAAAEQIEEKFNPIREKLRVLENILTDAEANIKRDFGVIPPEYH